MSEHALKTWPKHFEAMTQGLKTFEVRQDDRGFKVGDTLRLAEWCPSRREYSGRVIEREVTHILRGGQFGIEDGYVVMSIARFT